MAIVVASNSENDTGGSAATTLVITAPDCISDGDLLVMIISRDVNSGDVSSWPTGFTGIFGQDTASGDLDIAVKRACSECGSYTFTSLTSDAMAGLMWRVTCGCTCFTACGPYGLNGANVPCLAALTTGGSNASPDPQPLHVSTRQRAAQNGLVATVVLTTNTTAWVEACSGAPSGYTIAGFTEGGFQQVTAAYKACSAFRYEDIAVWAMGPGNDFWVTQSFFLRAAVPFIKAVCPPSGSVAGGTSVTLTGINFQVGACCVTSITIGGNAATCLSIASDTSMTFVTPAASCCNRGIARIIMTNGAGANIGTEPFDLFSYINTGDSIQIRGITIGARVAPQSTTFCLKLPSGTVSGDLLLSMIHVDDGASRCDLTYPDCLASFSNENGSTAGDLHMGWKQADGSEPATLQFTSASSNSWLGTLMRISGAITASAPTAPACPVNATNNAPDPPAICAASCAGNHLVLVFLGSNTTLGGLGFCIPLLECFTAPSGYNIAAQLFAVNDSVLSIAAKNLCNATCENPGAWSVGSSETFTSMSALILSATITPTISSLTPSSGSTAGGDSVVIAGTGFTCPISAIRIGGVCVTSFTRDSDCQITIITPPHGAGTKDTIVTNPCTSSVNSANDDFSYLGTPGKSGGKGKGANTGGGNKGNKLGKGKGGGNDEGGGNDGGGNDAGGTDLDPVLFVGTPPSASDILHVSLINCNSNTQVIGIWPSSISKSLRIMKIEYQSLGASANGLEMYFGIGANITTNAGKEVAEFRTAAIAYQGPKHWNDFQGPKGFPGEPLSIRGTAAVFNQPTKVYVTYREE